MKAEHVIVEKFTAGKTHKTFSYAWKRCMACLHQSRRWGSAVAKSGGEMKETSSPRLCGWVHRQGLSRSLYLTHAQKKNIENKMKGLMRACPPVAKPHDRTWHRSTDAKPFFLPFSLAPLLFSWYCIPLLFRLRTIFGKVKIRRFGTKNILVARGIQKILKKQLHPSTPSQILGRDSI